jgi:hypothetical protein
MVHREFFEVLASVLNPKMDVSELQPISNGFAVAFVTIHAVSLGTVG